MIERNLGAYLLQRVKEAPVLTVLGPRQSGKTTLLRHLFPQKPYVSLEDPEHREEAETDPRAFLGRFPSGGILDEIQRVPTLLSYIQGIVDAHKQAGEFILTGSQQLGLLASVSQSLAGRTALATLLPCSLDELSRFSDAPSTSLDHVMLTGGYPRIFDRHVPPHGWLSDYIETYIERDVRQIQNIGDLRAFRRFVQLCAGRTAQVLNMSNLAADAGISHNTAKAWLSALEASFIIFLLPAFHRNLNKRLVKAPKLHFVDTGIVCSLLGIESTTVLNRHPLRGAIFETWVVSEIYKQRLHGGKKPNMYHMRDTRGREVDLLIEDATTLTAVEMKSGQTIAQDFFAQLTYLGELAASDPLIASYVPRLIYGGNDYVMRSSGEVLGWAKIHDCVW